MECKMKFFVPFLAIFMFGCAAKSPAPNPDAALKVGVENVSITLNNIKPKSDSLVSRYPDEAGVQAIFAEEINRALSQREASKGALAVGNIARLSVEVTYNRRFAHVSAGVTMPTGGFSVTAFDQAGDIIWQNGRDDIVVQGRVFLNLIDIYKVPFGLFRVDEEEKYLRIWAGAIARTIYTQAAKENVETASLGAGN
jgi:hypothetical protein